MRGKITTSGFDEYLERIQKAGRDIDAAIHEALKDGGAVAIEGMHRRVPKDTLNLENHLEATEPQQDGNYSFVLVGISKRANAETARYGYAQEFGTSSMQGHPYIRPTMDEDRAKIRAAIRKSLVESGKI